LRTLLKLSPEDRQELAMERRRRSSGAERECGCISGEQNRKKVTIPGTRRLQAAA
jgi:hypothetical protein